MDWNRTSILRWGPASCALILLWIGTTGCTILAGGAALGAAGGAIASRDIRVRPGASVRVEFASPSDIPIEYHGEADTAWLPRTEYLVGRIERARGDTLWIELSEARTATSRLRYRRRQALVTVDQRGPGTSIVPLANRPAYIVAGAAFGTVLSAGAVLIYCGFHECMS